MARSPYAWKAPGCPQCSSYPNKCVGRPGEEVLVDEHSRDQKAYCQSCWAMDPDGADGAARRPQLRQNNGRQPAESWRGHRAQPKQPRQPSPKMGGPHSAEKSRSSVDSDGESSDDLSGEVIRRGWLGMHRGPHEIEQRYVVLYHDRLEHFIKAAVGRNRPNGAFHFEDLVSVHPVGDNGFAFKTHGGHLEFTLVDGKGVGDWLRAFAIAGLFVDSRPVERGFESSSQLMAQQLTGKMPTKERSSEVVLCGMVHVLKPNRTDLAYGVLYDDCFEQYADKQDVKAGIRPRFVIPLSSVLAVETDSVCIIVRMVNSDAYRFRGAARTSWKDLNNWLRAWRGAVWNCRRGNVSRTAPVDEQSSPLPWAEFEVGTSSGSRTGVRADPRPLDTQHQRNAEGSTCTMADIFRDIAGETILYQGHVKCVRTEGDLEPVLGLVTNQWLRLYSEFPVRRQQGASPAKQAPEKELELSAKISLADMLSIERIPNGLIVSLEGEQLVMHLGSMREREIWAAHLSHYCTGGSEAAASAPSVWHGEAKQHTIPERPSSAPSERTRARASSSSMTPQRQTVSLGLEGRATNPRGSNLQEGRATNSRGSLVEGGGVGGSCSSVLQKSAAAGPRSSLANVAADASENYQPPRFAKSRMLQSSQLANLNWEDAYFQTDEFQRWRSQHSEIRKQGLFALQTCFQTAAGADMSAVDLNYFVLFRSVLVQWEDPRAAVKAATPVATYVLSGVQKVEVMNQGFILHHKPPYESMRRLRLYARSNEDLHAWLRVLLPTIAPTGVTDIGNVEQQGDDMCGNATLSSLRSFAHRGSMRTGRRRSSTESSSSEVFYGGEEVEASPVSQTSAPATPERNRHEHAALSSFPASPTRVRASRSTPRSPSPQGHRARSLPGPRSLSPRRSFKYTVARPDPLARFGSPLRSSSKVKPGSPISGELGVIDEGSPRSPRSWTSDGSLATDPIEERRYGKPFIISPSHARKINGAAWPKPRAKKVTSAPQGKGVDRNAETPLPRPPQGLPCRWSRKSSSSATFSAAEARS